MTDSYLAGIEVLTAAGVGQDALRNRAAEVAPDFVRSALAFTYGEILARPGLDLKSRILGAIAAHAALGDAPEQLREHVRSALHLGWTTGEVIEMIVQTSAHAGVAATLKALSDCHDLLVERDPASQTCEEGPSSDGQL